MVISLHTELTAGNHVTIWTQGRIICDGTHCSRIPCFKGPSESEINWSTSSTLFYWLQRGTSELLENCYKKMKRRLNSISLMFVIIHLVWLMIKIHNISWLSVSWSWFMRWYCTGGEGAGVYTYPIDYRE